MLSITVFFGFLIIIQIILFSSFEGERVDRQTNFKISDTPLAKLTNATGWKKDYAGKWISAPNKIPSLDSDIDEFSEIVGEHNFTELELREVLYKNEKYIMLLFKRISAGYEYPELKLGLYSYTYKYLYVFDPKELKKLEKVKDKKINEIKIECLVSYHDFNNDLVWEELPLELDMEIDCDYSHKLFLLIFPNKEKQFVQFFFYGRGGSYDYHRFTLKEIEDEEEFFENNYYETTYSEFNNFLKIDNN